LVHACVYLPLQVLMKTDVWRQLETGHARPDERLPATVSFRRIRITKA
jgi:hypothetical protein